MCKRVAKEEVKILVLEPGKKPWVKEIKNISDIYSLVYFPYIEIKISENLTAIATKEPENFTFNRKIRNIKTYGRVLVVAKNDAAITSMTEFQIRKYGGIEIGKD